MSSRKTAGGGSISEEQKYVTRKNLLRKMKRTKQKVYVEVSDSKDNIKERRPSRDKVFCVVDNKESSEDNVAVPGENSNRKPQQSDKIKRKSHSTINWESKTPFVFTFSIHNAFPPIAEAEETELIGDTSVVKGKEKKEEVTNEVSQKSQQNELSNGKTTDETDKPPPVPPRRTRNKSSSDEKNNLGNSWPRCSGQKWSSLTSLPSEINSVMCTRAPAKRRRDSLLKKKCPSTSVLQRHPSSSSSNGSGGDSFELESLTLDITEIRLREQAKQPTNISRKNQLEVPNAQGRRSGRFQHSVSSDSIRSCPEVSGIYLNQDALPNCQTSPSSHQRSSSVKLQKPKYVKSSSVPTSSENSIDSCFYSGKSKSVKRRERTSGRRNNKDSRPRSFTTFDNYQQMIHNQSLGMFYGMQSNNSVSDSFLYGSPISPTSRRMPLVVADDPGSVSDLESILEHEHSCRSFDVSRENSLVSEEEVANICSDLRRLTVNGETENGYVRVLPSPRVSPDIFHSVPGVVVTSDSDETSDSQTDKSSSVHKGQNFLSVPKKVHRRRSSSSITSASDESDCEPSPLLSRRGRRAAIVDTKKLGDVSPTNLSPDVSPCNSCDEGEGASNIAERLRRRRSSVELAMNIYPGDLLVQEHHKKLLKRNTVSDFHVLRNGSNPNVSEDNKKGRQSFSLLKLMKSRSKEALSQLEDILNNMKTSEFKDNHLAAYKDVHWSDLIASSDKQPDIVPLCLPELERKRREAVWELFKSECVFLIDHLMVLKHCFLEPLKKVQVEGQLMYAEPQDLFGNLDELCYVSYTFCKDFIAALLKDMSNTEFGSTHVLMKAFDRFSSHSKDGDVYHTYCLNYTNALTYLDRLRRHDDFFEFEKRCEQDSRCKRLQLTDLLVAPMQHYTKLPLLLSNIRKYTECEEESQQLMDTIDKFETSLQKMEDKMKWVKNYERVQDIQRQLTWPTVTDLDPRVFIPEYLKTALLKQPCERLLANPTRQLLHEGPLTLVESSKSIDVYLFLFDDILLITKTKKSARKKQQANDPNIKPNTQSDKIAYTVHRQPIALDRLGVHDISQSEAAVNGIKCAFVIVQISRFQQIIGVFTLQAPTDVSKNTWLEKLTEARDKFGTESVSRQSSFKENKNPNPEDKPPSPSVQTLKRQRKINILQSSHTKSYSVDSVSDSASIPVYYYHMCHDLFLRGDKSE